VPDSIGRSPRPPTVALAITGASGAIYATRTLAALLASGVHVEVVISDYGRRLNWVRPPVSTGCCRF
jgi:hypothetical protein